MAKNISSSVSRPTFSGDLAKALDADVASVTGVISIVDPGKAGGWYLRMATIQGTYGVLTVQQDGSWSYALNTAHAAVVALPTGSTLTDAFTVHNKHGKPQTVTITINGVATP